MARTSEERLREALDLIDKLRGIAQRPGESDADRVALENLTKLLSVRAPRWC